ncbi:response regulator [Singulisphaera sp. PoT]|uniref:response regulator n=1 Tax=Singulisphaera sp. PoT TaxID=3411797 RepID=UPI003BF54B14
MNRSSQVKPRLLVVEDDRTTSSALRAIFHRKGWEVFTASSLAEALPLLSTIPSPDYLILDLMLPDGDGMTLLERVRGESLATRVAVTTGSNDQHRLDAVARLRPEVFLRKPISLQELLKGFGVDS